MAACIVWLLAYIGLGLALTLGNRPLSVVQGAQRQQYRNHLGRGRIRQTGELDGERNNLLHLKLYPYESLHRDDHLSEWLVFKDDQSTGSTSRSPLSVLIDEMIEEPRDLHNVLFALSPAVLSMLYPEYVSTLSQGTEHFVYDQPNLMDDHRHSRKRSRIEIGESGGGGGGLYQSNHNVNHKHNINNKINNNNNVNNQRNSRKNGGLPILLYEGNNDDKTSATESRQSNFDDIFEDTLSTATTLKTELSFERAADMLRDFHNGGTDFLSRPHFYERNSNNHYKLPGKRNQNQLSVGRRSLELHQPTPKSSGTSIASQFMLRTTRGSRQYDVPQVGEFPFNPFFTTPFSNIF